MSRPGLEIFADEAAAAEAAAALIAGALAAPGRRSLTVTGGASPGPVYDRLSRMDLGWKQVAVTLSDDRWVEPTSPLSNARLVSQRLLVGKAAAAPFQPLKLAGATPGDDAVAVEPRIADLTPFAAVLLGMGPDGHIASLFPGAPGLAGALDLDGPRLCIGVPRAGLEPFVPRISLTLRALTDAALVILLTGGQDKRAIIERALGDAHDAAPVAALLHQDRAPVRILWAP